MIKSLSITGIPSTSNDREQVWAAIKDLMIELWAYREGLESRDRPFEWSKSYSN